MTSPVVADPDMRADAVRRLIEQTERDGEVALTPLGGMDLCTLGGPRHAVLPQILTDTWLNMSPSERDKFIDHSTERLVANGMLIPDPGHDVQPVYAMSPELGIVLAARCRPAFAIVGQSAGTLLPSLGMFAFGDQDRPVRAILAEILFKIPGTDGKRRIAAARLLGCVYTYHLVTPSRAASILADWAIVSAEKPSGWRKQPERVLTRFQPDHEQRKLGYRVTVRGDGTSAYIMGLSQDSPQAMQSCTRQELEPVMARLLSGDLP